MKHIVLIGGGSGTSQLLETFCQEGSWSLDAIIAMSDSGGSTGKLRDDYLVPALGDIVKNLSALGGESTSWIKYRHQSGFLSGHTTGNLLLLGLVQSFGLEVAMSKIHDLLGYSKDFVIPSSYTPHHIRMTTRDDQVFHSEVEILSYTHFSHRVKSIELFPHVCAADQALKSLEKADAIIIGPGTLYTSLIASLLPEGISEAIIRSPAPKFLIANAANFPPGHCEGYSLQTYLNELRRFTGIEFHYILAHDGTDIDTPKRIAVDVCDARVTTMNVLAEKAENISGKLDAIPRNTLRHDAKKVKKWVESLI